MDNCNLAESFKNPKLISSQIAIKVMILFRKQGLKFAKFQLRKCQSRIFCAGRRKRPKFSHSPGHSDQICVQMLQKLQRTELQP